jgi:Rieske Fe-S protein
MEPQAPSAAASIWPVSFAIGVTALVVGLIVNPLLLVPLGLLIAVVSGTLWIRMPHRAVTAPAPAIEKEPYQQRFPRSRLLERATLGLGGLVSLAATLPALGFAVLPSLLGRRHRAIDVGPTSAYPEGEFVLATFLSDPQQGEISRRTAYIRNNGLAGSAPSFTILSSRCTHVGCPTQPGAVPDPNKAKNIRTAQGQVVHLVPLRSLSGFGCPCHGSQFDTEGNRTAGPAPRPLDRYEFSIINGRLRLDQLISVSRIEGTGAAARFRRFNLRAAGEPTQGLERLLYPLQPRQ